MSTVVKNPSPKAQFQEVSTNITKHRDMVGTNEFNRATNYALLEYQSMLAKGASTFNECASAHLKVTGALEFIQVMRNLGESFTPTVAPRIADNLDHKA